MRQKITVRESRAALKERKSFKLGEPRKPARGPKQPQSHTHRHSGQREKLRQRTLADLQTSPRRKHKSEEKLALLGGERSRIREQQLQGLETPTQTGGTGLGRGSWGRGWRSRARACAIRPPWLLPHTQSPLPFPQGSARRGRPLHSSARPHPAGREGSGILAGAAEGPPASGVETRVRGGKP